MEGIIHPALTSINLLPSITHRHLKTSTKPPLLTSFTSSTHKSSFTSTQPILTTSYKIVTACGPTTSTTAHSSPSTFTASNSTKHFHWMVILDKPSPNIIHSKPLLINYYVSTLHNALRSDEKDAQRCIYDACCDKTNFGFCCFVDEQTSHVLAGMPGVLSVKPDQDTSSANKDYSYDFNIDENVVSPPTALLFPEGSKNWLVCVEKPSALVSSKAQMVDYYVGILLKVLGNEKDAQMCLYHTSWQSNYGFCCVLDDRCAQHLATVPGVLSVQPDENFESENKYYGGTRLSSDPLNSAGTDTSKTKLFITGLSFYTSEKTLRAAFEPFGELVQVKIIMDKISKRSKGYAFVEYATEDAAAIALNEMNGKIINGWMIVVDRAKSKPLFNRIS
ncbi:hypothetical protein RND81_09G200900 [Saponaria officinalis]|uniref:RRM domain-containing protein n=1 Tax=Saponaria officinalis TaxID=3572 RepID=A0AAW1IPG4_SAPOF